MIHARQRSFSLHWSTARSVSQKRKSYNSRPPFDRHGPSLCRRHSIGTAATVSDRDSQQQITRQERKAPEARRRRLVILSAFRRSPKSTSKLEKRPLSAAAGFLLYICSSYPPPFLSSHITSSYALALFPSAIIIMVADPSTAVANQAQPIASKKAAMEPRRVKFSGNSGQLASKPG